MAEIPLRDYISSIESLIDGNQFDEAIAHCRFILEQQSKCVDAYRLMAKAALEKEDDRAAADLFQRVLSVDPDDYLARVGLSIVYDRRNDLEQALWQMERGFEVMPGNEGIHSELKRLYARRDGAEPARINLTRGALARMYAQGDLYSEAIAELRAILNDSPDRADLQVLLAQVLWRDERRTEAATVAERLLNQLPFCLDANLLLGEIWLNGGMSEDGELLLRRAQAVDPDNRRAPVLLGAASPLSEQTTMVTRLEYEVVPNGVAAGSLAQTDNVPDWLAGLAALGGEEEDETEAPTVPVPTLEAEAQLPDWIEDDEQESETSVTATAEADTDGVPDWLGAMARGSEPLQAPETEETEAESGDLPDWMATTHEVEALARAQDEIDEAPADYQASDLPDWLAGGEIEADQSQADDTQPESDLPDWMATTREVEALARAQDEIDEAPADYQASDLPDWLSAGQVDIQEEETQTGYIEPESDVPNWLSAMRRAPVEEVEAESETAELPDWLSASDVDSDDEGAMQESSAAAPASGVPDWLSDLGTLPTEVAETEAPSGGIAQGNIPDWLQDLRPQAEETEPELPPIELPEVEESEIPDWMQAASDQPADEAMDFLRRLGESAKIEPEPVAEAEVTEPQFEDSDETPSPEDALAFLTKLSAGKEEQLRAQAEEEATARMADIMGGEKKRSEPKSEPPASAQVETRQPEPEAVPSADDALAFLQSFAAGKEEQLREQAEEEATARMSEIMGGERKRSEPKPEPAHMVETAASDESEAMPSSEDALAFLTRLSAGKEEQLRAQAEEEATARMADIMGGEKKRTEPKPEPKSEPEVKKITLGKAEVDAAARIADIMSREKKPAETAPAPVSQQPSAQGTREEVPSAEDALAFLQSFAVGKEDELRERAEQEGDARSVAIMGGPPGTSPLRPPSTDEVPPELSAMFEEAPESEPEPEPVVEMEIEETAPVSASPARFWLITAADEGANPISPDYFVRAAEPAPATAPAKPKTERVAKKPAATHVVEPEPEPEPEPLPILPAAGADELYERLENDPDDHEARLGLARVLWAAGAHDESLEMYLALLKTDELQYEVIDDLRRNSDTQPHPDWYRALGDAYMKAGDLPNALDAYRQALTQL